MLCDSCLDLTKGTFKKIVIQFNQTSYSTTCSLLYSNCKYFTFIPCIKKWVHNSTDLYVKPDVLISFYKMVDIGLCRSGCNAFDRQSCLHFTMYQIVIFGVVLFGLENLQLWFDNLPPWFCTFKVLLRGVLFNTAVLILCILTIIKFLFLCILRRVPEMNDDLVARIIICSVSLWGIIENVMKFLFFDYKPVVNEVRSLFKSSQFIPLCFNKRRIQLI